MSKRNDKQYTSLVRPYVFVLQEGLEIKQDYMDYSLLMLQTGCMETLRSPTAFMRKSKQNEKKSKKQARFPSFAIGKTVAK